MPVSICDWPRRSLANCGSWKSGGTPSRSIPEYWNGEIPWISAKSLRQFRVCSAEDKISQIGAKNGGSLVKSGTLLFVVRGMSLKSEFRLGVTERTVAFNQDLKALVPGQDVDARFLGYSLKVREADILAMVDEAGHGTGRLSTDRIGSLQIPIPSLAEQRAIADALGDVDALIAAQQKLIAKKRAIKTATMQRLLTGKQRLPGFGEGYGFKESEVGEIPEDWTISSLGELATSGPTNGYSGPTSESDSGSLTLRLSATTSGRLVLAPETTKRLSERIPLSSDLYLQPGDLLVQRSNTLDLVGTAAVFDGPSFTYIYPDLMTRFRFGSTETSHWVWRYLNSQSGRRILRGLAAGSTGTMPKLSGGSFRTILLPIPTRPEQRAIAQVLTDIGAEITALEKRLAKTKDIKQGMMQELLSGRTRLV